MKINIEGMHCSSCEDTLQAAIESVKGVDSVKVDHVSGTAQIDGSPISQDIIDAVSGCGYEVSASPQAEPPSASTISNEKINTFTQLAPLIIILVYIFLGALVANRISFNLNSFMMDFMGLFFIVFSLFKFIDYKSFPPAFSKYDPLAKKVVVYAWIYPFLEAFIGLCFLLRINIFTSTLITIAILGMTTFGVVIKLMKRETIQCACIGTSLSLPLTKATLIENGIMLFMAFWMLSTLLK